MARTRWLISNLIVSDRNESVKNIRARKKKKELVSKNGEKNHRKEKKDRQKIKCCVQEAECNSYAFGPKSEKSFSR